MTQQLILHLVVNWEVFTINICSFIAKIVFQILHLVLFGLSIKLGLRSEGQICTTMQIGHPFLRWLPSAILDFQIFKHLVARQATVHCRTKFYQNRAMVAKISHLTIFKMAAIRYVGFLKI